MPGQFADLAPFYDELMLNVPYDVWAEYVLELWRHVNHQPRRVLDCACGTGNVSFELSRMGFEVTGVDLSQGMIARAQEKSQSSPWPCRFVQGDLTSFDLGETFDSASCLYDSLNYILEPAQLRQAFASIHHHMEAGGVWVFDMNSDYAFRADLFTQSSLGSRRPLQYEWQASFDRQTRICTVEMTFHRGRETFYETHRERAYEREEVEAMLSETGWEILHCFDAYTLNAPHERSERWYWVARA